MRENCSRPREARWAFSLDHLGVPLPGSRALWATPAQDVLWSPTLPMPCPGHSPDWQGVNGDR